MSRRLYNFNSLSVIIWALNNAQTNDAASSIDQFSFDDYFIQFNIISSH